MKPMKIRHEFESRPLASAWRTKAGDMSQAEVHRLLDAVLQTLEGWHRHGRWHGMLSLDDIWMDDGGNVQILPPSAQPDAVSGSREGYAALECYGAAGLDLVQGTKADIYAAAAIAWSLAEGRRPPGALQRAVQGQMAEAALMQAAASWSDRRLGDAVSKGLAFFADDRPADVTAMRGLLGEAAQLPEPTLAAVASAPAVSSPADTALSDEETVIVPDLELPLSEGPELQAPEHRQAMPGSEEVEHSVLDDLDSVPADPYLDAIVAPVVVDEMPPAGSSAHEAGSAVAADEIGDVPAARAASGQEPAEKADRAPVGLVAGVVLALGIGVGAWWWLGQDGTGAGEEQMLAQAAPEQVENDGNQTSPSLEFQEPASEPDGMMAAADVASAGVAPEGTAAFPDPVDGQVTAPSQEAGVPATDIAAGSSPLEASEGDFGGTAEREAQSLSTEEAAVPLEADAQGARVDAAQEEETQQDQEPAPSEAPVATHVSLNIAPWAEVFVNGSSRGVSPPMKSLQLAPGTYQVELRNASQPPVQLRLQVRQGQAAAISHRFSSSAQ